MREKFLAAASVKRKRINAGQNGGAEAIAIAALPRAFVPKAIVIGSSTGGPQALAELLTNLTPPLPAPVFIAQHMPRPFTAALAHRLQVQSGHCVVEAKDGDAITNGLSTLRRAACR